MEYEISRRGHSKILENGFTFDNVAGPFSKTKEVYNMIGHPVIQSVVDGYNGTIFLYGQTTSGKTYTMLGNKNDPGILPYAIKDLFYEVNNKKEENFTLKVSYIEIYNEQINDLLQPGKGNLKIVEDKEQGVSVQGCNQEQVWSFDQVIQLMNYGEEHRKYRANHMHDHSSRSHTIFRIFLQSKGKDGQQSGSSCSLNLVDLAGSERLKDTYSDTPQKDQQGETKYINKSLFTLANVIKKLASRNGGHIPYRDSKLTRLLSNSLGGNSVTAVVCNISPASCNFFQTLSTLKFAQRAKKVENRPILTELHRTSDFDDFAFQKIQEALKQEKIRVVELEKVLKEKEIENEELKQGIIVLKAQVQESRNTSFQLRDIGNITHTSDVSEIIKNALNQANLLKHQKAIPLIKDLQTLLKKYSSQEIFKEFELSVIEPQNETLQIPELFQEQSKTILKKFETYTVTSQEDLQDNIQTFAKLYTFHIQTIEDQYSVAIKNLEEEFSTKINKFTESNQKENFDDQKSEVLLYQITFDHKQLLEKLKKRFKVQQTKLYEIFDQVIQIINMILPKDIKHLISEEILSQQTQPTTIQKPDPPSDKSIWVWGSGKDGRLGTGREEEQISPYNLKNWDFSLVQSGYHHCLALKANGEVYSWGRGGQGQLGQKTLLNLLSPMRVSCLSGIKIKHIACGWQHSIALSMNGHVFSWGCGDQGQLGNGQFENQKEPQEIGFFASHFIKEIESGYSHCAAITDKGELYMWGNNSDGRMFHQNLGYHAEQNSYSINDLFMDRPIQVDTSKIDDQKIISISLGVTHSALITEDGSLVTAGEGYSGQLGIDFKECNEESQILSLIQDEDDGVESERLKVCIFTKVGFFGPGQDNQASKVSCGDAFTLILDTDGYCFSMGSACYSKLGYPKTEEFVYQPQLIEGLKTHIIVDIQAGCRHAAVITDKGELYMWGFNIFHQTGNPANNENQILPEIVKFDQEIKVKNVSCGYFHTIALS